MSLEAIERITKAEEEMRGKMAAAEGEGRKLRADADAAGEALLEAVRKECAAAEKSLLEQAEQRAALRSAEITRAAEADAEKLRQTAEANLPKAVEFIIERVVRS